MPVDSKEERIDIKKLTVEPIPPRSRDSWIFDPNNFVPKETWQELEDVIADLPKEPWKESYSQALFYLSITNTEKAKKLKIETSKLSPSDTTSDAVKFKAACKSVAPELLNLDEYDEKLTRELIDDLLDMGGEATLIDEQFEDLLAIKFLYPNMEFSLDWDECNDLLEYHKTSSGLAQARVLAVIRLFEPNLYKQLVPDKKQWEYFKSVFQSALGEQIHDWFGFLKDTSLLRILAADEIKITDDKIELIFHKDLSQEDDKTPELPETRRF